MRQTELSPGRRGRGMRQTELHLGRRGSEKSIKKEQVNIVIACSSYKDYLNNVPSNPDSDAGLD
jgi:hypothetical protein